MGRPKWKDVTSYSRNAPEQIPTMWEMALPGCKIVVHRHLSDDGWFGTCYSLGEERHRLARPFLEEAQLEFLDYLAEKTERLAKELLKVIE